MFEDLKWLVDLQKIDNEIYQLTSEERNMDSHISRMKHEIEESAIKRVKLIRRQRELQEDKDSYEADIVDHKRILDQKQIDLDNDKKTKKEHIKREVKKLEKAVEVFDERATELNVEIENIKFELDTIDKNISRIEKKIRAENKKKIEIGKLTEKNLEKLTHKKMSVEKLVRVPFLNHYNRIMQIRNGIAITFVTEEGLCNGCKIHIPYQLQQKIKLKDDYNICEGCGRILVDIEMLAPSRQEKKAAAKEDVKQNSKENKKTEAKSVKKTKVNSGKTALKQPAGKKIPAEKPEAKPKPQPKAKTKTAAKPVKKAVPVPKTKPKVTKKKK
ncbi:MAG TPA: hypothetical protein PKW56_04945 [Clostridiales bacterium]|nr:hypothetical protein [Clostridiales bacterium]